MTTKAGEHYQFSDSEMQQIAMSAGPAIWEKFVEIQQKMLDNQTETIRGIVTHHQEDIMKAFNALVAENNEQKIRISALEKIGRAMMWLSVKVGVVTGIGGTVLYIIFQSKLNALLRHFGLVK